MAAGVGTQHISWQDLYLQLLNIPQVDNGSALARDSLNQLKMLVTTRGTTTKTIMTQARFFLSRDENPLPLILVLSILVSPCQKIFLRTPGFIEQIAHLITNENRIIDESTRIVDTDIRAKLVSLIRLINKNYRNYTLSAQDLLSGVENLLDIRFFQKNYLRLLDISIPAAPADNDVINQLKTLIFNGFSLQKIQTSSRAYLEALTPSSNATSPLILILSILASPHQLIESPDFIDFTHKLIREAIPNFTSFYRSKEEDDAARQRLNELTILADFIVTGYNICTDYTPAALSTELFFIGLSEEQFFEPLGRDKLTLDSFVRGDGTNFLLLQGFDAQELVSYAGDVSFRNVVDSPRSAHFLKFLQLLGICLPSDTTASANAYFVAGGTYQNVVLKDGSPGRAKLIDYKELIPVLLQAVFTHNLSLQLVQDTLAAFQALQLQDYIDIYQVNCKFYDDDVSYPLLTCLTLKLSQHPRNKLILESICDALLLIDPKKFQQAAVKSIHAALIRGDLAVLDFFSQRDDLKDSVLTTISKTIYDEIISKGYSPTLTFLIEHAPQQILPEAFARATELQFTHFKDDVVKTIETALANGEVAPLQLLIQGKEPLTTILKVQDLLFELTEKQRVELVQCVRKAIYDIIIDEASNGSDCTLRLLNSSVPGYITKEMENQAAEAKTFATGPDLVLAGLSSELFYLPVNDDTTTFLRVAATAGSGSSEHDSTNSSAESPESSEYDSV